MVLVLALLAFIRAYALHVKEGVDHPVPADSSASPTANGRVYGNAAIRQAIAEAAEDDDRKALVREMDNMIREGMGLASELSVPVQSEKTANGWKIEGGGPSAEQQGKADAFRQRVEELLEQRNPALLADYRDGCNDYIHKEKEDGETSDRSADKRSDTEKMLALASAERRTAAWEIEVCLEGLARARKAI